MIGKQVVYYDNYLIDVGIKYMPSGEICVGRYEEKFNQLKPQDNSDKSILLWVLGQGQRQFGRRVNEVRQGVQETYQANVQTEIANYVNDRIEGYYQIKSDGFLTVCVKINDQ